MLTFERITIELAPDQRKALQELVDGGVYVSPNEAITEALAAWLARRQLRQPAEKARLEQHWDQGQSSSGATPGSLEAEALAAAERHRAKW